MAEILRAEGLNAFQVDQLANQTATSLATYPVVILAQTTLTATQAALFGSYVVNVGLLVAMLPDAQLASGFGLGSIGGATTEGYLLPSASSPLTAGITQQTLRFQGSADDYTLNGGTTVATLYSSETTPTSFPAVVTSSFGSGQAVAFAYDLAQTIAYLR
jgi:hypothetical protein